MPRKLLCCEQHLRHWVGQLWRADQIGALTIDTVDKINSVLTSPGSELPGYNRLKEATGP